MRTTFEMFGHKPETVRFPVAFSRHRNMTKHFYKKKLLMTTEAIFALGFNDLSLNCVNLWYNLVSSRQCQRESESTSQWWLTPTVRPLSAFNFPVFVFIEATSVRPRRSYHNKCCYCCCGFLCVATTWTAFFYCNVILQRQRFSC